MNREGNEFLIVVSAKYFRNEGLNLKVSMRCEFTHPQSEMASVIQIKEANLEYFENN